MPEAKEARDGSPGCCYERERERETEGVLGRILLNRESYLTGRDRGDGFTRREIRFTRLRGELERFGSPGCC